MNTIMCWLIWSILGAESILALALLISGFCLRAREKRRAKSAREVARHYSSMLSLNGAARDPAWAMQCIKDVRSKATVDEDCLSGLMRYMLGHRVRTSEIQALIDVEIGRADRGAIRLCGFLARTAPLAGLAGTLIGVQAALSAFATNRTDPGLIVAGFSTALQTTLAGVVVAFVCMGASRLLIEPSLKRTAMAIFDLVMGLAPRVQAVRTLATKDFVSGSTMPVKEPPQVLSANASESRLQRSEESLPGDVNRVASAGQKDRLKPECDCKPENQTLVQASHEAAPVESKVASASHRPKSEPADTVVIGGAGGGLSPGVCGNKLGREVTDNVSI